MKILLPFLFVFPCFFLNSQINPKDLQKIQKIIGKDFQQLPAQKKYPYTSVHSGDQVQMSSTVKGDTAGISYNNEYLLFRHPIAYKNGQEISRWMKTGYITVREYLDFQEYIRDSTAMEKIYCCLEDVEQADKLLDQATVDKIKKEGKKYDPYDRDYNRSVDAYMHKVYIPFSKKYKVDYSDEVTIPLVGDMYLPQPERLYRQREFDDRKFYFRYTDIYERLFDMPKDSVAVLFPYLTTLWNEDNKQRNLIQNLTPTLSNTYEWAKRSLYNKDEFSILAQTYNKLLPEEPVIGLTGMQTHAFCRWKQKQIQDQLNRNGLRYTVIVTTPIREDLQQSEPEKQLIIPARDYTQQWQITVSEYQKFMHSIRDSIQREKLFQTTKDDQQATEWLNYKNTFYDEGRTEWSQLDPKRREFNRRAFSLNYRRKIPQLDPEVLNQPEFNLYKYYYMDAQRRSIPGNTCLVLGKKYEDMKLVYMETGQMDGKDLVLDQINPLGQSTGVTSNETFTPYIVAETVHVLPSSNQEDSNPKSLIQGISYRQAMAFYHWKYPVHKLKPSDPWQKFVMPSEEQFLKIQRGESVIIPERKTAYPTPVFRYVVHIYPQ